MRRNHWLQLKLPAKADQGGLSERENWLSVHAHRTFWFLHDRVTVKSGVQLWDGLRVGDDVFIGPNVTFTNDKFPRSKQHPKHFANTVVMAGASIGWGSGATSGHNDWRARHGGAWCSGNTFSAGRSHRCRQSGTHRWVDGLRP